MVKYRNPILILLIFFFLAFSFYPTYFELKLSKNLADPNREFILEHNFYWPDFNLYLSKIRQGWQGNLLPQEKYTSEPHEGSLIQSFYALLGSIGKKLELDPNFSYQLGRIILSPLLLLVILFLVQYYFKLPSWQILAFIITLVSGSFPQIVTTPQGFAVGRYMEWWSNIDALQRITFIPHILFGQVVSFYLLYKLTIKSFSHLTVKQLLIFILLGNMVGLVFPPSLITLNGVILLLYIIQFTKQIINKFSCHSWWQPRNPFFLISGSRITSTGSVQGKSEMTSDVLFSKSNILFIVFTLPSFLYLLILTKQIPWSSLVDFHRTHPMMVPLDQYILGTGPIFFLGMTGAVISIVKRDKKYQPLIFWVLTTFLFAAFFSIVKEQSPLRFTQTGLFIPLGILGTYLFQEIWTRLSFLVSTQESKLPNQWIPDQVRDDFFHITNRVLQFFFIIFIIFYILENLFIMTTSLKWQTTFIKQRVQATIPLVPYPPQTMYPLKEWMEGIRWLRDKTNQTNVVLAEITAGNFIPAYSGNFVYFGQSNTVDYDRKLLEIDRFFAGKLSPNQAEIFLKTGRIKYIFYSVQEKEKSGGKNLESLYSFLKPVFNNNLVVIYVYQF